MNIQTLVKPNVYYDSLVLMHLNNQLLKMPGVHKAIVMMATKQNLATIKNQGLITEEMNQPHPNHLIIVVAADGQEESQAAITKALSYLENKLTQEAHITFKYKTLDAAIRNMPGVNMVSISLPGNYAGVEARRALEAGLHVFLFSDNVPLQEEIDLKKLALEKKRICMGPDCGTAIIGGAYLGFANAVRKGSIGVVGASGTGIQEATTLVHRLGSGISHAIGTGGRDVSIYVKGVTFLTGLEFLARDPSTKVILIVSKPPSSAVKEKVMELVKKIGKPVVVNMIGSTTTEYETGNTFMAETIEDAALMAVTLDRGQTPLLYHEEELKALAASENARLMPSQIYFRGLFSGGSFANETAMLLQSSLKEVYGNISLPGVLPLKDPLISIRHTCLDMGDDIFTVGKPHPILAPSLRYQRMLTEAADPSTGVLYLDVVLGFGCHPDPATEFAEYIQEAKEIAKKGGRHLPVIICVIGVEEDPQVYSKQIKILRDAGALVAPTNAAATNFAIGILTRCYPERKTIKVHSLSTSDGLELQDLSFGLPEQANVINLGLEIFAKSLRAQKVPVIHVNFQPPAGGNESIAKILDDLL